MLDIVRFASICYSCFNEASHSNEYPLHDSKLSVDIDSISGRILDNEANEASNE